MYRLRALTEQQFEAAVYFLQQQDYASMPSVRIKENEPFDVA